jgi:chaperonin GroEL (HSP60 family)
MRLALQNAAAVAGLLITTEVLITDRPEPRNIGGMPPAEM